MSFPHFPQLDQMDCGPTCLRIVAAYYGKRYSLQGLREKCHISREGISMLGICDAAEEIGFRTTTMPITWTFLRSAIVLPCIIHWHENHFVVLYKIQKRRGIWWVYISDPAIGLVKYSEKDFLQSWLTTETMVDAEDDRNYELGLDKELISVASLLSNADNQDDDDTKTNFTIIKKPAGLVVLLEPTPKFYSEPGEKQAKLNISYLLQYLRPYRSYLIQLILAIFTASAISFILPFLTQMVVDKGIGTGNLSFVVMILIAQVALTLGQMANNLIRNWLMLHMTARISISLISDFLAKLMRLPIAFFDSKMVGDIMQRITDYDRIRTFLTGSLLSIVMAVVTFVVFGIVMGAYNLMILGVFLVGSTLYIGWILLFLKRRYKLDMMRFQEASANQSSIVQLINGMQDIKLNNCEKQKRWEWERIQARLFHVSIKGLTLSQTQTVGGTFIDQTKNIIISFLAASAVIEGNMTLGMMVALQYIIGQLNAPLSQFIDFVQTTQDAKISLERLNEIEKRDDEEPLGQDQICEIPDDAEIEFKNVVFQYSGPHSDKVLNEINLTIPANKITAIVGASGSGKTTMLKMMLGFYAPISGEVTLGGSRLQSYSASSWRRKCGTVMQEGYIFSDTIANNIGVSDEHPNMKRVRQAAVIGNIDAYIDELPLHYNTKIGADGKGMSTGQKQRLLIARAAYKDAKYLFFDEATNSLDANNERTIMERLNWLFKGKTVVIVAHRLSTVKNADNIIVLDHGRIVEQGTHTELTAKRGYYFDLVKNQLELGS